MKSGLCGGPLTEWCLWQGSQSAVVIGVLPPDFFPPGWTSPVGDGLLITHAGWATIAPDGGLTAPIGRLRAGATAAAAQQEVAALAEALDLDTPTGSSRSSPLFRVDPLETHLFDRWADYAWLVVAGASLVLMMACANLAGATTRAKENRG